MKLREEDEDVTNLSDGFHLSAARGQDKEKTRVVVLLLRLREDWCQDLVRKTICRESTGRQVGFKELDRRAETVLD